jgi:K(+)-stimulated pyrophosphate-energized sodium pump
LAITDIIYFIPLLGVLALIFTFFKSSWIKKQEEGNERMQKIAGYIARGAMSFLKAEYRVLGIFVIIVGSLLALTADPEKSHWLITVAFLVGAFSSALAGFIGMSVATKANVRTTNAARTSLSKALDVSFTGGTVMGISVVSLGLIGLSTLFIIFQHMFNADGANGASMRRVLEVLTGFSLGAESIALFARVGGGIFTKAADVGADLVGKVEAGIPEDDPRNPAVIADNVGDNVGDVAGMGADLFGSYVSTILATMVLGATVTLENDKFGGISPVMLPLLIAAIGIIFSIIGSYFVKIKENGNPQTALNKGNFGSIILTAIASYFVIDWVLPSSFIIGGETFHPINVFATVIIGLVVGTLMSIVTEFYCSMGKNPVQTIAKQSLSGAATNIISGLSVGMMSTALPILILAIGIVSSFMMAGIYGVAIAATGMMATTGIQLAIDAFGPIADNAGGIAEMSALPKEVRERTDILDSVGNTTAAIGKGFAIASAALTSLALFAAFKEITGLKVIDISDAKVLAGLFVGGMIPFLFSALAMRSVGRAANAMVEEVRRQFREIKGLLEGKENVEPDYEKCIEISTTASIREMIIPGLLPIVIPIIVGFFAGAAVLAAVLAGVAVTGVLMALFQSNAGGAWDNAKKAIEKGLEINGKMYYKGSDPHKAAVIGDTVGDPFKDTSGPSLNILIKLMSIVSLVIAPLISDHTVGETAPAKATIETVIVPSPELNTLKGVYIVDNAHSFIEFSVRHFLSSAKGGMKLDTGSISITEDLASSSMDIVLNAASINTGNEDRDEHLNSADFFETGKYPNITFKSTSIQHNAEGPFRYKAIGMLTIKDVTKEVAIPFNYLGETLRGDKPAVYTFEGEITINRKDYHVGGDSKALGDDVKISFSIESQINK